MPLSIRSMHQNWICHCIIRLNFQLVYISGSKGESGTEKPSVSHYTYTSAPPCLYCPGSLQWDTALPLALLSKAAGRRNSSASSPCHRWCRPLPSHRGCRQLVIQQDSPNPPGSWRKAHGRSQRKRLETTLRLFGPSSSVINCFNKSLFHFTHCR